MTVNEQGYCSFAIGTDECPFPVGTVEYFDWQDGWLEAMWDFYDREQIVIK